MMDAYGTSCNNHFMVDVSQIVMLYILNLCNCNKLEEKRGKNSIRNKYL